MQILGHDIPSDPDYDPNCGFFSHDEAAILYHIAQRVGGVWVDVGSRFGWTTAHLIAAGRPVIAVDPCYADERYEARFIKNLLAVEPIYIKYEGIAQELSVSMWVEPQDGFVIDGNHDHPEPLNDVRAALRIAKDACAFVLHDFYGQPIIDAVKFLMLEGFNTRIYWTPNGIALCWRGMPEFLAPFHVRDPQICWQDVRRPLKGFDFEACL